MKIEVNKCCFVCHSFENRLLFELDYSLFNYPGKFAIRKCSNCGLLFNSPRLKDEELFKLYDNNYYFFQRSDFDEFNRVVSLYKRTVTLIPKNNFVKLVAEVGSGKGYLLALMKNLGWSVQGIEISSEASQYAVSKFGVPTFRGTVEKYSNNEDYKTFPVIMALDVIEHVPEPIKFLKGIDKILSNDGILIIDTPNGNSKNIDNLGSKWEAFNPFHIYFFSTSILDTLLTNMGYSIEKSFSYNNKEKKINLKQDIGYLLFKLKIYKPIEIIYRKLKKIMKPEINTNDLIKIAVENIRNGNNYFDTDDSKDILAKENRGDNIVIIARKFSN